MHSIARILAMAGTSFLLLAAFAFAPGPSADVDPQNKYASMKLS